jgi:hypothetical protein
LDELTPQADQPSGKIVLCASTLVTKWPAFLGYLFGMSSDPFFAFVRFRRGHIGADGSSCNVAQESGTRYRIDSRNYARYGYARGGDCDSVASRFLIRSFIRNAPVNGLMHIPPSDLQSVAILDARKMSNFACQELSA